MPLVYREVPSSESVITDDQWCQEPSAHPPTVVFRKTIPPRDSSPPGAPRSRKTLLLAYLGASVINGGRRNFQHAFSALPVQWSYSSPPFPPPPAPVLKVWTVVVTAECLNRFSFDVGLPNVSY
ncbi:hypothetical protein KM043_016343 [Ampulex compressa]|nr:hypothetical protein KM043_016343 [Ampulex compressa]